MSETKTCGICGQSHGEITKQKLRWNRKADCDDAAGMPGWRWKTERATMYCHEKCAADLERGNETVYSDAPLIIWCVALGVVIFFFTFILMSLSEGGF